MNQSALTNLMQKRTASILFRKKIDFFKICSIIISSLQVVKGFCKFNSLKHLQIPLFCWCFLFIQLLLYVLSTYLKRSDKRQFVATIIFHWLLFANQIISIIQKDTALGINWQWSRYLVLLFSPLYHKMNFLSTTFFSNLELIFNSCYNGFVITL